MTSISRLTDVHCHVTDTLQTLTEEALTQLQTGRLILMGTRPGDWGAVDEMTRAHGDRFLSSFGLHPWFVDRVTQETPDWMELLRRQLQSSPSSLVGEVGLDGIAKDPITGLRYPMEAQLKAFEAQYNLAAEFKRPLSVHMVQASGLMVDFFRRMSADKTQCHPPSIMLHSFTGSPETARSLLKLPRIGKMLYFSFSTLVSARSAKVAERLVSIPKDRILLESDVHDISEVDTRMEEILQLVASIRGWTLHETLKQLASNTETFLTST